MRRLIVLAASLVPLLAFAANDVSAQALSGGVSPGGGVRMGGAVSGGGRALSGGGFGGGYRVNPGAGGYGYRGGAYRGGAGWGYRPNRGYGGGYYGRSGYWRRGYGGGWGWGAGGLAAGAILGGAAAYPYCYGTPYYEEPSYYYRRPYYAAPVSSGIGDYCQTPVRTCQLINPADLGASCSCRVAGGRARGSVIP